MNNDSDLVQIWKALADPSRRSILDLLRERPRTTGELCNSFPVSRFAIMKHLTILEDAGLVLVRRHGRERWNYLNVVPLQQVYERWLRPYEAQWATSLLQLQRQVEQTQERISHMAEQTVAATSTLLHIEQQVTIQAPPARVFEAITNDISNWWGAPYLISSDARALIIEPKLGGRFYEDWGNGQGALWATVSSIKKDAILELTGPIAMAGAVHGIVCFELEASGDATVLKLSHRAIGEVGEQEQTVYSSGWKDLLERRLKAYVEQGICYGIGHEPSED